MRVGARRRGWRPSAGGRFANRDRTRDCVEEWRIEPELQAELVDLVLHGAGGGQGLEVFGGAAHQLGLKLVDLAALPPLQGQLDGGALLPEDEVAQDGKRLADDLRRGGGVRGALVSSGLRTRPQFRMCNSLPPGRQRQQ